jgi:hypothetical protein
MLSCISAKSTAASAWRWLSTCGGFRLVDDEGIILDVIKEEKIQKGSARKNEIMM